MSTPIRIAKETAIAATVAATRGVEIVCGEVNMGSSFAHLPPPRSD